MRTPRDRRQAILRSLAESGLSVAEFCRREALVPNTVHRWRRECDRAAPARGRQSGFVEAIVNGSTAAPIVIEVRGGRRVGVASTADDELIRRVIVLLEGLDAEVACA